MLGWNVKSRSSDALVCILSACATFVSVVSHSLDLQPLCLFGRQHVKSLEVSCASSAAAGPVVLCVVWLFLTGV